jgi:hypothetical protein
MLKPLRIATLELVLAHQQCLEPTIIPTDLAGSSIEREPVAETGVHRSSDVDGTKDVVAAFDLDWSPGYQDFEALNITELPAYWNGSCDFLMPPSLPSNDQVFEFTTPPAVVHNATPTSIICDGGVEIADATRVEL